MVNLYTSIYLVEAAAGAECLKHSLFFLFFFHLFNLESDSLLSSMTPFCY